MTTLTMNQVKVLNLLKKAEDCVERLEKVRKEFEYSLLKKEMKKVLTEIQDGTFARNWLMENQVGRPQFNAMRRIEAEHPIEKVGKELREMMSWIDTKKLD